MKPAEQPLVAVERHREILRQAAAHRVVTVKGLANVLGVHGMTVRRDLDLLTHRGMLERFYGGARLTERAGAEVGYHVRSAENITAKAYIALAALNLIEKGQSVALDASTTCLALANVLDTRASAVLTTGLEAANALAALNIPFALTGGDFYASSRSFVGPLAMRVHEKLHPDMLFISGYGFTPRAGFTEPFVPEAELKAQLIAAARTVVVLLDSSKFGRESLSSFANAQDIDVLVTEVAPEAGVMEALGAAGIRVIVADALRERPETSGSVTR